MREFPSSLKVNDMIIKIKEEKRSSISENIYGLFDGDELEITVTDLGNKENRKLTLLHEFVHIMENQYQVEFTETEVDIISHSFYSLLKNNRKLVQYLMEK